mmetsp:Transcript_33059/g.104597  ORF Transcript_33059/g.104597 Transcript_33059/m.104597 type:complete len:772 (-) Transcript_33059:70-2385(-)
MRDAEFSPRLPGLGAPHGASRPWRGAGRPRRRVGFDWDFEVLAPKKPRGRRLKALAPRDPNAFAGASSAPASGVERYENGVEVAADEEEEEAEAADASVLRWLLFVAPEELACEVLNFLGGAGIAALFCVSRDCRESAALYHGACTAIACEASLYLPGGYAYGWKRLFWEQLLPARRKFEDTEGAAGGDRRKNAGDFKVQVAVRFRPGGQTDAKIVLPLHQRIKLLDRGESLRSLAEEMEGLDNAAVAKVKAGEELPPELVEALLEAGALAKLNDRATKDSLSESRPETEADVASEEAQPAAGHDGAAELDDAEDNAEDNAEAAEVRTAAAEATAKVRGRIHHAPGKKNHSDADAEGEDEAQPEGTTVSARVLNVAPGRVTMFMGGRGVRPFFFSRVFDDASEQTQVYGQTARDAVVSALNGFNACIMCYGQTGSGKTYTMFGPGKAADNAFDFIVRNPGGKEPRMPASAGMALRAASEVIAARNRIPGVTMVVTVSYCEIYNEKLTCLLSGNPVTLRDAGDGEATLVNAHEEPVGDVYGILDVLRRGEERKHYAATAMNERSSRAHTVLVLRIAQAHEKRGTVVRSQLHLVDLAGCEQLRKSKAEGTQRTEAISINYSLLVLGKCITALAASKTAMPYREAALTRLLRGALGGDSRTTVVVTGSMSDAQAEETANALKFGERCGRVLNRAQQAVSSVAEAVRAIDTALAQCRASMQSLEQRGKTNAPSYRKLTQRYGQLMQKWRELQLVANVTGAGSAADDEAKEMEAAA